MTQHFNSFSELEQLLPKAKRNNKKKKEFKPDTVYTRKNDTEFARFKRFSKMAKNQEIKLQKRVTKKELEDLEEDI